MFFLSSLSSLGVFIFIICNLMQYHLKMKFNLAADHSYFMHILSAHNPRVAFAVIMNNENIMNFLTNSNCVGLNLNHIYTNITS